MQLYADDRRGEAGWQEENACEIQLAHAGWSKLLVRMYAGE